MVGCLLLGRKDFEFAVLGMGIGNTRGVGGSLTVGEENLIAKGITQHPHTMGGLFLGEAMRDGNMRGIEEVHQSSDSFKRSAFSATVRASITP